MADTLREVRSFDKQRLRSVITQCMRTSHYGALSSNYENRLYISHSEELTLDHTFFIINQETSKLKYLSPNKSLNYSLVICTVEKQKMEKN